MKKSFGHLCLYVFMLSLSVFVPMYILLSGSTTLMPLAQAGAILGAVGGIYLACHGAVAVRAAERKASIVSHQHLSLALAMIQATPMWRIILNQMVRIAQVALLLSIDQNLFAALTVAGMLGVLIHRGMVEAYFARIPHWKKPCPMHNAHGGGDFPASYGKAYTGYAHHSEQPFAVRDGKTYIKAACIDEAYWRGPNLGSVKDC